LILMLHIYVHHPQEYVTMTGLVTEYAIGSCGVCLVQMAVVQVG
jgi:hypothetical protein